VVHFLLQENPLTFTRTWFPNNQAICAATSKFRMAQRHGEAWSLSCPRLPWEAQDALSFHYTYPGLPAAVYRDPFLLPGQQANFSPRETFQNSEAAPASLWQASLAMCGIGNYRPARHETVKKLRSCETQGWATWAEALTSDIHLAQADTWEVPRGMWPKPVSWQGQWVLLSFSGRICTKASARCRMRFQHARTLFSLTEFKDWGALGCVVFRDCADPTLSHPIRHSINEPTRHRLPSSPLRQCSSIRRRTPPQT
jgi:hypothetical protein